jgi:iron-sulfur cluster assembly accessory protein
MSNFTITEQAFKRISEIADGAYLRISVEGGGCSGFKYKYEFDKNKSEDDLLFQSPLSSVVIDSVSLGFLEGAVLTYVEDLGSAGFNIENPNTSARCGCGNSFSVNL